MDRDCMPNSISHMNDVMPNALALSTTTTVATMLAEPLEIGL